MPQITTCQHGIVDDGQRQPHVPQRLGHTVRRTADVSDHRQVGYLERGKFDSRDRVPRERSSVDVRVVHRYHTQPILGAIDAPRHRPDIERPRLEVVGQRHGKCEGHPGSGFEAERLGIHSGPAAGHLRPHLARDRRCGVVRQGDGEVPRFATDLQHRIARLEDHIESGEDDQGPPYLTERLVAESVRGLPMERQTPLLEEHRERTSHRCRPEGKAVDTEESAIGNTRWRQPAVQRTVPRSLKEVRVDGQPIGHQLHRHDIDLPGTHRRPIAGARPTRQDTHALLRPHDQPGRYGGGVPAQHRERKGISRCAVPPVGIYVEDRPPGYPNRLGEM